MYSSYFIHKSRMYIYIYILHTVHTYVRCQSRHKHSECMPKFKCPVYLSHLGRHLVQAIGIPTGPTFRTEGRRWRRTLGDLAQYIQRCVPALEGIPQRCFDFCWSCNIPGWWFHIFCLNHFHPDNWGIFPFFKRVETTNYSYIVR